MFVRDWMSEPARTIRDGQMISDALELMRIHRIEHVPVLDEEGRLVGMLHLANLVGRGTAGAPRTDRVRVHMEGGSLAIHPEAPLAVSAEILRNENRVALPVAASGYVIGVLSRSHVRAALASGVEPKREFAAPTRRDAA